MPSETKPKEEVVDELKAKPAGKKPAKKQPETVVKKDVIDPGFVTLVWKGKVEVYNCNHCNFSTRVRRDMIVHALSCRKEND